MQYYINIISIQWVLTDSSLQMEIKFHICDLRKNKTGSTLGPTLPRPSLGLSPHRQGESLGSLQRHTAVLCLQTAPACSQLSTVKTPPRTLCPRLNHSNIQMFSLKSERNYNEKHSLTLLELLQILCLLPSLDSVL